MSMILDGSNGVQFNDSSLQGAAASPYGLKNRIINGDMRIDQRNAGASVSVDNAEVYSLDRWQAADSTDGVFTVQQSTIAPTGFSNSLKVTISTNDSSLSATQYALIRQKIEGFNTADLSFGTASAKTVTLSFYVYSSVTGTFGGAIQNGDFNRSYPFQYTISSANTWTNITITIAGDTTGTWATNNVTGLIVVFSLGAGTTYSGTANTWTASYLQQVTGNTNLINTNGATFYITGVQLEVGSTATPFERRLYGTELALCQRYAYMVPQTTDIGAGDGAVVSDSAYMSSTSTLYAQTKLPVSMRATPSISVTGTSNFEIGYTDGTITTVNGTSISAIPQLVTVDRIFYQVAGSGHASQPAHIRYHTDASSLKPCFLVTAEL